MLNVFHQLPSKVQTITEACIELHNLMRLHAPDIQNWEVDSEDPGHNVIKGPWRMGFDQEDIDDMQMGNHSACTCSTTSMTKLEVESNGKKACYNSEIH